VTPGDETHSGIRRSVRAQPPAALDHPSGVGHPQRQVRKPIAVACVGVTSVPGESVHDNGLSGRNGQGDEPRVVVQRISLARAREEVTRRPRTVAVRSVEHLQTAAVGTDTAGVARGQSHAHGSSALGGPTWPRGKGRRRERVQDEAVDASRGVNGALRGEV